MKRLIAILLTIVLVFTLASCKGKEVSISFETNQSSITLDPITIKKDESLDLSTYTDRMVVDGYVFKGWYLDEGFNEYVRTLEAENNITVYAKWAKIHTVSFDTLEGTTIDSQRVEDGKIATEPLTNPTKTGFYFDGWYSDSEYKKAFDFYQEIKADTTIYAKWLRSCEVTFVTTGSAVSSLAFVEGRSAIQFTETSTKPGYDFAGWFKDQAYTTVITSTQGLTTSISVYAKFTPHTYTLTYNRNGGSGTNKTVNATYDTDIILDECTYTKAGYSFKEWNTKKDGSGESYNVGDSIRNLTEDARGEAEIYAIYEANTYTLKFDSNGGTGSLSAINLTYDTEQTLPTNTFTKTGYDFIGWSKDKNDSEAEYSDNERVKNLAESGEVTLYAIYKEQSYTITFDKNNTNATGTVNPLTIKYTETKELPTNAFVLYGYSFKEWNTKADGTGTSYLNEALVEGRIGEITLYAIYEAKEVTVSFNLGQGVDPIQSVKIKYNDKYQNLPTPTRLGYSFDGFYKEEGLVNKVDGNTVVNTEENHTLYAKWTALTYTIKFDKNSDTATGSIADLTFTYPPTTEKLTKSTLINEGMFFQGWAVTKTGSVIYHDEAELSNIRISNDELVITLYAVWFNGYTISFNTDGGTQVDSITQVIGGEITKPADPTKTGYSFIGWLDGNTLIDSFPTTMMEGGKNYKASWKANTYKVVFNKNNESATGEMAELSFNYDEEKALIGNAFALNHHNFVGWSLTSDGEVVYTNLQVVKNLTTLDNGVVTLYAKYEETNKVITYNKNNESATGTVNNTTIEKAHSFTARQNGYSLIGYSFKEWNTKADGTGTTYTPGETYEIFDETLTLYAIWTKNIYTITFDPNGGSDVESESIGYGDNYKLLNTPTKTGYEFKEWNTKADGTGTKITTSSTYNVDGNQKLYAIYTPNKYTVVFNKNSESATGEMANKECTYDVTESLTKNAFTYLNHRFVSWNTKADGTGTSYTDQSEIINLVNTGEITLYAIWERFDITVSVVIFKEGELVETKYEYEVVAGTNIVSGQAYNLNEVILSQVQHDLDMECPGKTFKGFFTTTNLDRLLDIDDIYNENNTNSYTIYAYYTTEVTFDLSDGGYENVVVDLYKSGTRNIDGSYNALKSLPNVAEKAGYIYFFIISADDEVLEESKTISVKFVKNDAYSLLMNNVTKHELPSNGGFKYDLTLNDKTYTSYYVFSGVYSFNMSDANILYSSSDKFNTNSIAVDGSYTKLTFNPQVGGYVLVSGSKDLAYNYYQLHITQLTSGFSISSGYYEYSRLSMDSTKYLNKEKGVYSSNPYQIGTDNIYKLRFNILDANSVPIESADFSKTYTAKLLGQTEEAEKTSLVSVEHGSRDILVSEVLYSGYAYGIDSNEDGELETVYFYVLNRNDNDEDSSYDRIKFTESAVGNRFEITIKPMDTGNSVNDDATAELFAYINDGLNVESHAELKVAYRDYKINESNVTPIINIHSKILCELSESQLNIDGSPLNVFTGYDQAKIHQAGLTLEDGLSDTGNVYVRAVHSSEIYNNNLVVNGNFFVIDGSELPVVELTADGKGLTSTQGDNNNGRFFADPEHSKYSTKYVKNMQISIFHEYLTYMVDEDHVGIKQAGNKVTYNNMNIISNTITPVVDFKGTEEDQDIQVDVAVRNSGGYNGIMARRCKIETNNVILDYCGIGLTASFDGASIDAKDTYIYYSWSNSIYSFGSNVVKLSNSELRYSGGASVHFDNIDANKTSDTNTDEVAYHFNSETQEFEEVVVTKKASLDIDQTSQLVNWVNGSEIWFQLYDMSALSGQLLSGMQGYVSGSTFDQQNPSNMYSVVKSYSKLSEGDTAYTSSFGGEYGGNTQLFNFAVIMRETSPDGADRRCVPETTFRNKDLALNTTITRYPMYTENGDMSFQAYARLNANGISKPILDAVNNDMWMYCYPVSGYSGYCNVAQEIAPGVTGNAIAQAMSTYQGYTANKALLVGSNLATEAGTFYTESAYAQGLMMHGIKDHSGNATGYGWVEIGLNVPGVMNAFIYTYYYQGYDIVG